MESGKFNIQKNQCVVKIDFLAHKCLVSFYVIVKAWVFFPTSFIKTLISFIRHALSWHGHFSQLQPSNATILDLRCWHPYEWNGGMTVATWRIGFKELIECYFLLKNAKHPIVWCPVFVTVDFWIHLLSSGYHVRYSEHKDKCDRIINFWSLQSVMQKKKPFQCCHYLKKSSGPWRLIFC